MRRAKLLPGLAVVSKRAAPRPTPDWLVSSRIDPIEEPVF